MPATTYAKKLMIEALVNKTAMPSFANSYVGLATGDPGVSGSLVSEVTAADYNRIPLTFGEYTTYMANDILTSWAPSSAWGLVTYVFLIDSSQGGNMLFYDSVSGVSPGPGDLVRIPIGNFTIS